MPGDTKSASLISSNTSGKDLDYVFETEGHARRQGQWRVPTTPSSWKTDMGKLTWIQKFSLGNTVRPNLKRELDGRWQMREAPPPPTHTSQHHLSFMLLSVTL